MVPCAGAVRDVLSVCVFNGVKNEQVRVSTEMRGMSPAGDRGRFVMTTPNALSGSLDA